MDTPTRGQAQEQGDERPWEKAGAVRRDDEPHRAALLILIGAGGLILDASSCLLLLPALLGLSLGIAVCVMAARDMEKMYKGSMDPGGMDRTRTASLLGFCAIVFAVIGMAVAVWAIGAIQSLL
ncbi:MAG TPA: hypothetical protein VG013_36010 [Gemmataceae bacterium]|nr:hypothetical protein [Gemmataceae bacterium]